MSTDTKLMQTLAAIGQSTTYNDIVSATGIDVKLLMSNVANLKRRGYVERINEGAPKCEIAYFRRTTAGDEVMLDEPEPELEPFPVVVMTSVQRAILRRPPLAIVWSAA